MSLLIFDEILKENYVIYMRMYVDDAYKISKECWSHLPLERII